MITEYHRPKTITQACELLSEPKSYPLGGGILLTHVADKSFSVVDLQDLGLDKIHKVGIKLEIGATSNLSKLLESRYIHRALAKALGLETTMNIRNLATVAGTLISCDGRSPFSTAMLALDAVLIFAPDNQTITLGNYFPTRLNLGGVRASTPGKLITKIEIPINIKLAFETVARTPADKPIVCVALARWPSGRTRLAVGGFGTAPTLAMDGNEPGGVEIAASNACADAADKWASKNYRSEIAAVLARRCLQSIEIE